MSGLSIDYLKVNFSERRYITFISLFERFLFYLDEMIRNEDKIDFNDMINRATSYILNGNYINNYKYVY